MSDDNVDTNEMFLCTCVCVCMVHSVNQIICCYIYINKNKTHLNYNELLIIIFIDVRFMDLGRILESSKEVNVYVCIYFWCYFGSVSDSVLFLFLKDLVILVVPCIKYKIPFISKRLKNTYIVSFLLL